MNKSKKTAKPAASAKRVTVSSVAEALILAGKTNAQVFAVLKRRFKLDESKKHYPGWYRARLVRQGRMTKKIAAANA